MNMPEASTIVVIIGALTTAGSILIRSVISGTRVATVLAQITTNSNVRASTKGTPGSESNSKARAKPAAPRTSPSINPTLISLVSVRPISTSLTSPTAMARIIVATVCEPALPAVPLTTGMKMVNETKAASKAALFSMIASVTREAANNGTNHTNR